MPCGEFIGENENEASRVIVIAVVLSVLFAVGIVSYMRPASSKWLTNRQQFRVGLLEFGCTAYVTQRMIPIRSHFMLIFAFSRAPRHIVSRHVAIHCAFSFLVCDSTRRKTYRHVSIDSRAWCAVSCNESGCQFLRNVNKISNRMRSNRASFVIGRVDGKYYSINPKRFSFGCTSMRS